MDNSIMESGSHNNYDATGNSAFDCNWWNKKHISADDDRSSRVSTPIHGVLPAGPSVFPCLGRKNKDGRTHYSLDDSRYSSQQTPASTLIPPLLKASSSSETTGEDVYHYTVAATERLFGGPLQIMYRARRWQPFTDPNEIFLRVFKSSLAAPTTLDLPRPTSTTVVVSAPMHHHVATLRSEMETLPDGTVIHRNSKGIHPHRTVVRTVTRYPDPHTGVMRTQIEVTAGDPRGWQDRPVQSEWCVCLGLHREMFAEECGATRYGGPDDHSTRATDPHDEDDDDWSWACREWLPVCC